MKILVYDIAADCGGALTILKSTYEAAINKYGDVEWVFVLSKPHFENTNNVKILNYPNVKKSWLHRIVFDKKTIKKIISKENPDLILNLQNIAIKTKVKQIVYMHQALPFIDYKFKLKQLKLWIYQNLIGRLIIKNLRQADEIIVQTNWIKDAISDKCKINKEKIRVVSPKCDLSLIKKYKKQNENIFFYPAAAFDYKNHRVIVEAVTAIKQDNYKVVFTLRGDESKEIVKLKSMSINQNLPIEWRGSMDLKTVCDYYAKSTLIFPSYVETFGLPLLEARTAHAPIISARTPWALEICDGYDKVQYFEYNDPESLTEILMKNITTKNK